MKIGNNLRLLVKTITSLEALSRGEYASSFIESLYRLVPIDVGATRYLT